MQILFASKLNISRWLQRNLDGEVEWSGSSQISIDIRVFIQCLNSPTFEILKGRNEIEKTRDVKYPEILWTHHHDQVCLAVPVLQEHIYSRQMNAYYGIMDGPGFDIANG